MTHEFESGFFAGNEPAWHGLGKVIEAESLDIYEALQVSGLAGWDLALIPAYANINGTMIEVPDARHVLRQKDGTILGTVGARYQPIPNEAAFEWCDQLVGLGAKIHTAGSLRNGKIVWALFRPDFKIELPDSTVDPYILVTNSHDGTRMLRALPTFVRVVCMNTLNAALAGSNNATTVAVKHTGLATLQNRLAEAQRVLGFTEKAARHLEKVATEMMAQHISDEDWRQFLDKLVPVPEDLGKGRTLAVQAQSDLNEIYYGHPTQDGIRGTAWGAFNATTFYFDHVAKTRLRGGRINRSKAEIEADEAENRAMRTWFGVNTLPQRAAGLLGIR